VPLQKQEPLTPPSLCSRMAASNTSILQQIGSPAELIGWGDAGLADGFRGFRHAIWVVYIIDEHPILPFRPHLESRPLRRARGGGTALLVGARARNLDLAHLQPVCCA